MKSLFKFLLLYLSILIQLVIGVGAIKQWTKNKLDEEIDANESQYKYAIKKFSVPLDHFSYAINGTFELRYLVNDTWQKGDNPPIFFYTGNEGNIEAIAQINGFLWDIAPIFGAVIVFAEHRYYGESLPYGEKTYSSIKNFVYLNTQQALRDYVDLIEFLRTDEELEHSPVIAFGGSYAGQLAAWIRIKYPHIVQGAIASSAPILQFSNVTDCRLFTRIATSAFRETNPICAKVIRSSWDAITNLTSTASGKRWMFIMWELCKPLKSQSDVQKLKNWLTNMYITLAMENYPYEIDFPTPLPARPVKQFCKHFTRTNLTNEKLLMVMKRAIDIYVNSSGQSPCIAMDDAVPNLTAIGWDYQTCAEMIMPICSDGIHDMFEPQSWDFEEHVTYCNKKYKIMPDPDIICKQYGCRDLQSATNIVFSNGLLDPWSAGGVLKDISRTAISIVIPNAAHHFDLRGHNSHDAYGVVRARDIHRNLIHKWIKDYNEFIEKTT